jgi:DNA (cytosine-5)-methyltransferase 1
VREDLGIDPVHPKPLAYRYSVRDALPWICSIKDGPDGYRDASTRASNTIVAGGYRPSENAYTARATYVEAETDISRYAIGAEWDKLKPGEGSEKYLNLKRTRIDGPSHCISADGGNPSTAGVCHPTEKRKFTIAELKRICGFPDDFILSGTYAQQWERCGRAVPPVMMSHIAATVRDEILGKL